VKGQWPGLALRRALLPDFARSCDPPLPPFDPRLRSAQVADAKARKGAGKGANALPACAGNEKGRTRWRGP